MTSLNLIDTSPLSEVTTESEVTENMLPECQTEFVIGDAPVSTVRTSPMYTLNITRSSNSYDITTSIKELLK